MFSATMLDLQNHSQAVAVAAWAASSPATGTIRRRLSRAAMATVDPAATAGMGWVPPS